MTDISRRRDPAVDGPATFDGHGSATRKLLASICRASPPLSVPELAKRAGGRKSGSVAGVVTTLVGYGVLIKESRRRKGRTVAVYSFNPAWSRALDDSLALVAVGKVSPGQQLVIVPTSGLGAAAALLEDRAVRDMVAWAVRFEDTAVGMILAIDEGGGPIGSADVLARLQRLGYGAATHLTTAEVLDPEGLGLWRERLAASENGPRLTAGS